MFCIYFYTVIVSPYKQNPLYLESRSSYFYQTTSYWYKEDLFKSKNYLKNTQTSLLSLTLKRKVQFHYININVDSIYAATDF